MKLCNRLLLGASVALFLVVGLSVAALFTWDARPVFRLRDGSTIRVVEIRYGKVGSFWFGPAWKQRVAPLANSLPPSVGSHLAMQSFDPAPGRTRGALVVALNYSGLVGVRYPFCTLRDGDGCRFRSVDNSTCETDEGEANVLYFPFFPRREATFRLEALVSAGGPLLPVGSVTIPSPISTGHPAWVAESLPATRKSGPLKVTLTEVTTGWSQVDRHRSANVEEGAFTRLRLNRSTPPPGWELIGVQLTDAMGGSYDFPDTDWSAEPGVICVRADNLCRREPAYRYRLEFRQVPVKGARLDREFLLGTLQLGAIPRNTAHELQLPDGRKVTVYLFETRNRRVLSGSWSAHAGESGSLQAEGAISGAAWSDVASPFGKWPDQQSFNLELPRGLRQARLRFGISQSRFVTFTVKPRWLPGK